MLLHRDINFNILSETLKEIHLQRDKAKSMYKRMLTQYSNSVQVWCSESFLDESELEE